MLKSKLNMQDLKTYAYIETVLAFLIVITTIFQYEALSSLFFYGTFVVLLFALSTLMSGNAKRYYFTLMFLIVSSSMISVLFSCFVSGFVPTIASMKQYIVFLTIIIYLFICMHIEPDKNLVNFILKINILFAVLYFFAQLFFPGRFQNGNITLNFTNPNLTGMWVLMTLFTLGISLFVFKSTVWRIVYSVLIATSLYVLDLTGSRNCMIALVIFVILVIFSVANKRKRCGKLEIFIFDILPAIFFVTYLAFVDNAVASKAFSFLITEGKELDSRMDIWRDGIENLSGIGQWLFGNFPYFKGGNMHNSHFVLLTSYGFVVLILVVVYIYRICTNINSEYKGKINVICMSAFMAVLCTGFGEGVIFSGGMGIFIMICNFIILCKYHYDDDNTKKIQRRKVKKMKILVTGYSGFIGSNMIKRLKRNYKGLVIYRFNSKSSLYDIDEYTKDCDFVFHFAATHRPKEESEYGKVNHGLTEYIVRSLERNNNNCPILYTSSVQAGNGSVYGDSKINAENAIIEHGQRTGSKAIIYRLTNTFGSGARPNGHSVVATFCYNIQRDIPIEVSDRDHEMHFCYIDDVIDSFIDHIENKKPISNGEIQMLPDEQVYTVSLGKLADTLYHFRKGQKNGSIPETKNDFEEKLLKTYSSYRS